MVYMYGEGGNDTYTNFVKGNSGQDNIVDSGGKDKLLLTDYKYPKEVRVSILDVNENGKADSLAILLDPKGVKNAVVILNHFDDTKSKPPIPHGPGYVELIQFKR
jgi:hypothetical protein